MTPMQRQMAQTLEYYPFEHGSPVARFVARVASYARYEPNTELGNEDAKELARLFDIYIKAQEAARQS